MKKTVALAFILVVLTFSIKAQSIKQDTSYFKITNYLWYTSSIFKGLVEKQTVENRDLIIPKVEKLIKCSHSELENLKSKYPNDPLLEKVEQWITVEEKNIEGLKGEEWKSKPMWQMGYYLVQLELEDLINKELCK